MNPLAQGRGNAQSQNTHLYDVDEEKIKCDVDGQQSEGNDVIALILPFQSKKSHKLRPQHHRDQSDAPAYDKA